MRHSLILALAALTSFAFDTASAALNIGDAAPNIKVAKWVKGGPIASLETNKVYVVEFWATWCGPCRQSIPHLTEMAHTFKDKATFVGVDVMEQNEAAVVKFVGAMAEKMDYNVAIDTEETFMANEWMRAINMAFPPRLSWIKPGGLPGLDTRWRDWIRRWRPWWMANGIWLSRRSVWRLIK